MIWTEHYHHLSMYEAALEEDALPLPSLCHACNRTHSLPDHYEVTWTMAQKSSAEHGSLCIECSSFLNHGMSIWLAETGRPMGRGLIPDDYRPSEVSEPLHHSLVEGALPHFPSLLPILSYYKLDS